MIRAISSLEKRRALRRGSFRRNNTKGAKLSAAAASEIRRRLQGAPQYSSAPRELAAEFNVHVSTIYWIRSRRPHPNTGKPVWSHATGQTLAALLERLK